MALDSVNNRLYFVDNQKLTQGVRRISYVPGGDSGQGSLDPTTLFDLAGSQSGTVFACGQTGCALPEVRARRMLQLLILKAISGLASEKVRRSFVSITREPRLPQISERALNLFKSLNLVASNRPGTGLAWIGHDLWGADSQTPFVIPKADTTCLAGTNPACSTANGAVVRPLLQWSARPRWWVISSIRQPTAIISISRQDRMSRGWAM